jgi:NAD(P)-dependent dehydrogenase (short-subunit alcohol dehydrogenase family)
VTAREIFSDGVAVITGAGNGIGAGLARHAAALGMTVVLVDVDAVAIAALRDELPHSVDLVCDVRDAEALEKLAAQVYFEIGPVRLLVNNAGVEQFGYLWDTPVANWDRLVAINVSGVFYGVRAFLPRMLAADTPSWVWNLSSIGGVAVAPLQAPYIMSKHAVLALTECLRLEVELAGHEDRIHVQAVLPGAVKSNIFETAGGVDGGDAAAAEAQRAAMMDIKAEAMDPITAAEVVFEQAAAGEFYLLTQPEYVGNAMSERADILANRRPPVLRTKQRFDPSRQ